MNLVVHIHTRVGTMATKFKSLLTDDKYEITESDAECNPGHHLVSPYSRNLIFGTGVGMNFQSYQCSFSN